MVYKRYRLMFITLCVLILVVIIIWENRFSLKVNHSRSREGNLRKKERGNKLDMLLLICLCADLPFKDEEFNTSVRTQNNGEAYCLTESDNGILDIDLNVERSYKVFSLVNASSAKCMDHFQKMAKSQGRIPQIFHFIWSDDKIPTESVSNLKRFRKLHPQWEFNFWTLESGRKLIENLEPQLLDFYNTCKLNVSRADILRYVIMFHVGGAYFDLDTYPYFPLDNLTTLDDCLIGPEPMENAVFLLNRRSVLSNAAFLCEANHPFFRKVLDLLRFDPNETDMLSIAGPIFLSDAFSVFINDLLSKSKYEARKALSIKVIRHEYFEFYLDGAKRQKFQRECNNLTKTNLFNECRGPRSMHQYCVDEFRKMKNEQRWQFDACSEWVSHGKLNRHLCRSDRYVEHKHLTTYGRLNKMIFEQSGKLTEIIPQIKIHL